MNGDCVCREIVLLGTIIKTQMEVHNEKRRNARNI